MMFKNRRKSKDIASHTKVVIQDISKELIPITGSNQFALLLHNLLTPDECSNLIKRAEEKGYDNATVAGPNGSQILRQDIRSCGRCIIDDTALADAIYDRILNAIKGHDEIKHKILHAPWVTSLSNMANINNKTQDRIKAVGLNERMRFLKYNPGHFFAPHQDIQYVRGPELGPDKQGEVSYITVQLYLNEKFKGGTTRFLSCRNSKRHYDVKPKIGSALIVSIWYLLCLYANMFIQICNAALYLILSHLSFLVCYGEPILV